MRVEGQIGIALDQLVEPRPYFVLIKPRFRWPALPLSSQRHHSKRFLTRCSSRPVNSAIAPMSAIMPTRKCSLAERPAHRVNNEASAAMDNGLWRLLPADATPLPWR